MTQAGSSSRRRTLVIGVLVLVATFASGVVVGSLCGRWLHGPRGRGEHGMRQKLPPMLRDLDLTDAQKARIQEIFDARKEAFDAVMRQSMEQLEPLRQQIDTEIRALLDPEQQARFDEARAREQREGPMRPPMHGGGPRGGYGDGPRAPRDPPGDKPPALPPQ